VRASRQWIVYSVIRVAIFAVVLAVLLIVGVNVWIAAIAAALIGLCVSYIALRGPRDEVAKSFVRLRATKDDDLDNDIENEALDRMEDGRTRPLE
jgi:uncharacterized membrane protein YphA (DoxX/SURF4 family)